MLKAAALCLVLCAFAFPMIAFAERSTDRSRCGSEEECTEYFMDDEEVEGGVVGPDGGLIRGQRSFRRAPLIRTRSDFVDVMLKSVENL